MKTKTAGIHMKKWMASMAIALGLLGGCDFGQQPYQDKTLTFEQRADDLLGRLTLEEKVGLMMNGSEEIERLGIPGYNWWNEALHGVARNGKATVFPQSIGLAATFDNDLVYDVFSAVSDEARVKHKQARDAGQVGKYQGLTMWTPNINIFRDPRWGRGQETYGEDPYLTSQMGLAVVKGLQGETKDGYVKLFACAKHYAVHSGPEWNRHSFNAENIDPRDLWETYLPAFETAVVEGKVKQVMCAYNRFEGEPCCGSDRLLAQILRNDWGYEGVVVSDCGAIDNFHKKERHGTHEDAAHASADAVLSGTDLECGRAYNAIPEAVERGLITEQDLDVSLRRLLISRFSLGEIDGYSPWDDLSDSLLNCQKHQELAYESAVKSIVLLKNDGVLPLSAHSKIGLIGPAVDDSVMQWGNYHGYPYQTTTLLQAFNKAFDEVVTYETAPNYIGKFKSLFTESSVNGASGLTLSVWTNENQDGAPAFVKQVTEETELRRKKEWVDGHGIGNESARFEGVLEPSVSGEIQFVINTVMDFELQVGGEVINTQRVSGTFHVASLEVQAGKQYPIQLDVVRKEGENHGLTFNYRRELQPDEAQMNKVFADVDVIVFAGGISAELEREDADVLAPGFLGGDRTHIELPEYQRKMIKSLTKSGKKIVMVNFSGSAIGLMPESKAANAILQAWYPGETGGKAIVDILSGAQNPSGRLPITLYENVDQLPDFEDYKMDGRTYRFMTEKPLYAFGHGLSYAQFSIDQAQIKNKEVTTSTPVEIEVALTNESERDGEEVLQIYMAKKGDEEGPVKTLVAYERVMVAAGKTVKQTLTLSPDQLKWWDEQAGKMKVSSGEYQLMVGNSSDDAEMYSLDLIIR